jgi:5'-deoxynucleotidase YfbR-like HD superfamily hydrolase
MKICKLSKKEAWIQTFSAKRINLLDPKVEDICIEDIAHALSMQCRFSGHCIDFYSVAQHSVFVSKLCDPEDALYGLLHDASEAYLVDIPKPLKYSGKFDVYLKFEEKMMKVIYKKFNLDREEPESVKNADRVMLMTEARDLATKFNPSDWGKVLPAAFKIKAVHHTDAKQMFLNRFHELMRLHEQRSQK